MSIHTSTTLSFGILLPVSDDKALHALHQELIDTYGLESEVDHLNGAEIEVKLKQKYPLLGYRYFGDYVTEGFEDADVIYVIDAIIEITSEDMLASPEKMPIRISKLTVSEEGVSQLHAFCAEHQIDEDPEWLITGSMG